MTVLDRTRLTDRLHFFHWPVSRAFCRIARLCIDGYTAEIMNTVEIFKRLKIGLSLVVGLVLGKLVGSLDEENYSLLFSIAFLIGAIGTQGMFRLLDLWQQKKRDQ